MGKDGKPLFPMPGLGKGMPGLGAGKGGKGAGFGRAAFTPEKKTMNVTKLPPNAKVDGRRANANPMGASITTSGDPQRGVRAGTPVYETYVQNRRAAEGAVGREHVPASYRRQVKDYFQAIRP